jgi:hypothetical protein
VLVTAVRKARTSSTLVGDPRASPVVTKESRPYGGVAAVANSARSEYSECPSVRNERCSSPGRGGSGGGVRRVLRSTCLLGPPSQPVPRPAYAGLTPFLPMSPLTRTEGTSQRVHADFIRSWTLVAALFLGFLFFL